MGISLAAAILDDRVSFSEFCGWGLSCFAVEPVFFVAVWGAPVAGGFDVDCGDRDRDGGV